MWVSIPRVVKILLSVAGLLGATAGEINAKEGSAPPEQGPPHSLHVRPKILDDSNSYFAIVGSFRTEKGAIRHLANLRRGDMTLVGGVFPPFGHSRYWIVATASYATLDEARVQASYAKRTMLQSDAFAWRMPQPKDGVPDVYDVRPASVALVQYNSLLRSPRPSTDLSTSYFVFLSEWPSQDAAETASRELLDAFPQLPVAVFPPRVGADRWRIALAAHASASDADQAISLARRLGIVENPILIQLPATDALTWRPSDRRLAQAQAEFRHRVEACFRDGSITMGAMRSCAGAWITPQTLAACIGDSIGDADPNIPRLGISEDCVAIPDTAEGALIIAQHGWDVTTELKLEMSNYLKVDDPTLNACLSQAKGDAAEMQKCVLSKLFTPAQLAALDCMKRGSGVDVAACFRDAALASGVGASTDRIKCLRDKGGTLEGAASCMPAGQQGSVRKMVEFQRCSMNVRSEVDFRRQCLPIIAVPQDVRARCIADAGTDPAKLRTCAIEAVPGGHAVLERADCLRNAGKDASKIAGCVKDDLGSTAASVTACIATNSSNSAEMIECLTKGDGNVEKVRGLLSCVRNYVGDKSSLLSKCGADVMSEGSQKLAACLLANGGDPTTALSKCGELPPDATRVARSVSCIRAASRDEDFAKCLVKAFPNRNLALETVLCAQQSAEDMTKLAACAAKQMGGTGGAVAVCLASQPAISRDPLQCLSAADPRLAEAQKLYTCVQKVGDPAGLIESCSQGLLDNKTRQAAACVARSSGDRAALAACAGQAILPGEAGRLVGCAASSQGAASFAICAAAPSINEEWRIAAECAVSTGGEPISFASCSGGRLTIRELGKCLTGKVGTDCFGPDNTIIKFYTGMWNDLTKGPGPNNEVVKAVNVIGKGVEHLGQEAGKELAHREENARKRFEKPLSQPGKTLECVVTLFHSC